MPTTIEQQIAALNEMTTGELAERYESLHGRSCRTRHRAYLIRKIAWRIQANAEGDLEERITRLRIRAAELADISEVRVMAPRSTVHPPSSATTPARVTRRVRSGPLLDPRLPSPGSAIVRQYKGRTIRVLVCEDGQLEYEGQTYPTLTSVAKAITGSHLNGYRFFHLQKRAKA